MNFSPKTAFATGAVTALIIGGSTAYASTGGDFHLGKFNQSDKTSVLKSTKGPALKLKSKSGEPPLAVNRRVKVDRLNADLVDGLDSSAFALATASVGTITAEGIGFDSDSNGVPEDITAIATCPAGSRLTGGGSMDLTPNGVTWASRPVNGSSWQVVVTTDNVSGSDGDVEAYALCYNPRVEVENDRTQTTRADVLAHPGPVLRRLLAGGATR